MNDECYERGGWKRCFWEVMKVMKGVDEGDSVRVLF